jgi:hypothetical protein
MSRIKTEDLPVAENLTPEEEALIEGAGLRSFCPTLEGLEDRQLMASHVAAALPVQPPALGGDASVGQVLSAPKIEIHTGLVASAASQEAARPLSTAFLDQLSADAVKLETQARAFLKDQIIGDWAGGSLSNQWTLKHALLANGPQIANEEVNGRLHLTYRVQYGQPTQECGIWMVFERKIKGADKVYSLTSAGLADWHNQFVSLFADGGKFEGVAKSEFQAKFVDGIYINKFDQNAFVDNAVEQSRKIEGRASWNWILGEVRAIDGGISVIIDRGFINNVRVFTKLEFKYSDADLNKGWLKATSVQDGKPTSTTWSAVSTFGYAPSFSGEYPADHRLKEAIWKLG